MSTTLAIHSISKMFRDGSGHRVVLDNLNLEVAPGEMVAVMGPSGSGKSTLLHLCAGLDRPDSGEILIDEKRVTTLSATALAMMRRREVGYVEQRLNLISSLTAIENVMLPLELDGVRGPEARRQALGALDNVGLLDRADETSDRLSGGEQQRVAIARALIGGRGLLLVDEPTAALDSLTGETIMALLRGRCDDDGVAVVIATHDATHAAWADRVVRLRDGSVL